jgi:hypothetical protein
MWYDSGLNTFRVRENGVTRDMAPPAVAGTEIGSLYRSDVVSTNSQTYVDAMGGQSVTPPLNASYFVMWEGRISDFLSAPIFLAISKNGVLVPDSERQYGTPDGGVGPFIVSTFLPNLLTSDNISALIKRGPGGNPNNAVEIAARRLTIIQKA